MIEPQESPIGLREDHVRHRAAPGHPCGDNCSLISTLSVLRLAPAGPGNSTCLVRLPPRFMVPEPDLLVCSQSITVEVSL